MNAISNNEIASEVVNNLEITDIKAETNTIVDNNTSNSNSIYIEQEQYSTMKNNLEFINCNLLVSNAFVLSVLIYLFLSKMLERRKI